MAESKLENSTVAQNRKDGKNSIILEARNLTRRFGDFVAVNSISFSVGSGEVFGIVGPNGAGKTTTIKMLTTLLPPTSGNATVGGFDIVHHASSVRRIIGYVPQLLSADGTLTGYENLLVFAKLYDLPSKEREKRISDSLHFMGLADSADKLVRSYSGGMIRRLEIAQAVLHRPHVLYLDEPTVGLDPVARDNVWKYVGALAKAGTTIIMTTHYMEEADAMCDEVAVMNHGIIAAVGSPSELKASVGSNGTTLDEVFEFYVGSTLENSETGENLKDVRRTRRTARRLG
ncbi:MAG TPA: ATP-binding cassette domain-containing protein [Candidatus Acidoferrales bacterium]|nr:ATP-binding cassette domain-containing protein [Candidatus Acidoferrales bacterium]